MTITTEAHLGERLKEDKTKSKNRTKPGELGHNVHIPFTLELAGYSYQLTLTCFLAFIKRLSEQPY